MEAEDSRPAQPGAKRFWTRGLILSVLASVAWAFFLFATRPTPSVALAANNSDHYSHVGAAVMAIHHGSEIYRHPTDDLCLRPASAASPLWARTIEAARELRVAPVDICFVRGGWTDVPLVVNWGRFPRPYPPGNLLLFLPVGWAYAHAGIGFAQACAWAMGLILLFGHVAALSLLFAVNPRGLGSRSLAAWLSVVAGGALVLGWSFAGFYDGLAVGPLCLAGAAWRARKPSLVLMFFGLACLAHFRGLWFLPLGIGAFWRTIGAVRLGKLSPGMGGQCLTGILAGAMAAMSLIWVAPFLAEFPVSHPLQISVIHGAPARSLLALLALFLAAGAAVWQGGRMLGFCGAWALLMCLFAPQAMPWHAISLVPLLALVPQRTGREATIWMLSTLIFVGIAVQLLFGASLWPTWIGLLLSRGGVG